MSILEGNKLIAEFMGVKYFTGFEGGICETSEDGRVLGESDQIAWLDYDRDWNLLMPAWVKFVVKYHELGRKGIYPGSRKLRSEFHDASDRGDIESCHEILTTGIQWYNSQPKTDNNDKE